LPFDLDTLATDTGALERRRGVCGGESLLRALLLYGLPKSTLERAARTAREANIANWSSVALFKRLVKAEGMLRSVFEHLLSHAIVPELRFGNYRLLSVDATCLCGPGATQTDQVLHVVYDLGKGLPASVDLTTNKGGETFGRHFGFGAGDLLLGDRGYGWEKSIVAALRSKARVLVRFEFDSIRLITDEGEKIWREQAEGCVPETGPVDFCVYLETWPGPLRAIGERNPKGQVVWYLTDLGHDELPLHEARKLYARRWQVELFFKRLKTILDLDELPSRDGPVARPWIWTKLILASLAVLVSHERFSPWTDTSEGDETEPLETVRIRLDGLNGSVAQHQTRSAKAWPTTRETTKEKSAQTRLPLETVGCLS
jgi:hypothetical protein